VLLLAAPAAASPEGLPPGHWAYEDLEHFEARGRVQLHGIRPYTRSEVAAWVASLEDSALTPAESQRVRRLRREFLDGEPLAASAERWDRPLLKLLDSGWGFAGDLDFDSDATAGDSTDLRGGARFETVVRWNESLAYETRYDVRLAAEEGARVGENMLSSRERVWHGLTAHNDRSYVAFARGPLRLAFGRDYLGWGARRGAELLISDAGTSLDAFTIRLGLGRFRLASTAALLSTSRNRNFAAHRLEIDAGPLQFGIQEAAVYESPHFDPTYLFPIAFFYGNQFNERADDNVLLGGDVKWTSRAGVFDAELLVDDFIYDGDPAPNKLGWRLGWTKAHAAFGTDFLWRCGYTRVGRWTFTHRRGTTYSYVAGRGGAGDPFLGTALGPDADRLEAAIEWSPRWPWSLRIGDSYVRRGDGNRDLTAWQPGEPYDLPFPSGRVETQHATEIGARAQLHGRAECGATLTRDHSRDSWRLRVGLRLDL
jgi:hypothetical protein